MKVIDKSILKNGTKIQLEDWTEDNQGFQIGAYPIAKNSSEYGFIRSGETFRLTIANNKYMDYTDENVKADYQALKDEEKTLKDLSRHFWDGRKDMFYLGMIEEHEITI